MLSNKSENTTQKIKPILLFIIIFSYFYIFLRLIFIQYSIITDVFLILIFFAGILSLLLLFGVESSTPQRETLYIEPNRIEGSEDGIGYASDVGRTRKLDEDSTLVMSSYPQDSAIRHLLIIADGMGGHSKGEVASRMAVESACQTITPWLQRDIDERMFTSVIGRSFQKANEMVYEYSYSNNIFAGMGTTLTLCVIDENILYIGHVGDTRAYKINEREITQLTKDHSHVQELIDKGEITQEEAKYHPQKNVITRVIGYYSSIPADIQKVQLGLNDRVLLCCDGLTNYVDDFEIKNVVLSSPTPQESCNSLIEIANQRGGGDNISVIVTPVLDKLIY